VGIVAEQILVQKAQAHFLAHGDAAAVGLVFAHQYAQQRGFAPAVEPDEANLILGLDVQVGLVVERTGAEVEIEVGNGNQFLCV